MPKHVILNNTPGSTDGTKFLRDDGTWQTPSGGPGGATDHSALTGLSGDDHTQYHTDARGDARYSSLGHSHSYETAGAVATHEAALDPHTQYLTSAEANAAYQPLTTVLTNTTASFTTTQETKLGGIAAGATVNATDAALRDRTFHTGTQVASTISDFNSVSRAQTEAELIAGTNVTITPAGSGATRTLTIAASSSGGSDPWTWIKLASNNTVSTTAYAVVTGLSFTAVANTTYLVQVYGAYQTAATTTGIGLTLDIPSGSIIGQVSVNTSATALGGLEIIADNASTGASTGVRAANTNTPISAFFVVAVGVTGGTIQLMQRSEIAASNTVLQANLTIMGRRTI